MTQAALDGALVLAGRYALSDRIAEGGMSVVWRGLDLRLHRDVAIKILTQRDERDRERVVREARLLASTPHPNIVQVLDVGIDDERPYIVMELLEGVGLDRVLGRGPIAAGEALEIIAAALDGLALVHSRGIVHRDLKPSNLFLARDPGLLDPSVHGVLAGKRVKILDFGVSRATDRTTPMKSALTTREGALVGTPEYMAPEQARGLPEIGPAADIYAMGVILFECLTQMLPFESPNPGDLIIAIATQAPPRLEELRPDLPASLATLVHKALAKKPEDRFESAQSMRKAIDAIRAEVEGSGSARVSYEALRQADRSQAITLDGRDVTPAPPEVDALPTRSMRPLWLVLAFALVGGLAALAWVRMSAEPTPSVPPETSAPEIATPTPATPPPTIASPVAPTPAAIAEPAVPDAGATGGRSVSPLATPSGAEITATRHPDDGETPPVSMARTADGVSSMARPAEGTAQDTSMSTTGTPRFRDLDY
ncbi:MAG: protein kinase [Sandaracinus sp.]